MINRKTHELRHKRALRVRKHLRGTSLKPRLCVVKTNAHIHVQMINDDAGHTLLAVSTASKDLKGTALGRKNKEAARKLGESVAELAKAHNITEVVFDRGSAKYHGVLAALADAARAGGLQF